MRCADNEPVASGEHGVWEAARLHERLPACDGWSGTALLRPRHAAHPIAIGEARQPSEVILMRVGRDDQIDAAIPGGDKSIEFYREPRRVWPAVDEHARIPTLYEYCVTLPHVEDGDTQLPCLRGTTALQKGRAGDEHRASKSASSLTLLVARGGVTLRWFGHLELTLPKEQRDPGDSQGEAHPHRRLARNGDAAERKAAPCSCDPRRGTKEGRGRSRRNRCDGIERWRQPCDLARDDCDHRRAGSWCHKGRDRQSERDRPDCNATEQCDYEAEG